MAAMPGVKAVAKNSIRALPLPLRKRFVEWLSGRKRLEARHWWAAEMLRDLERDDPNEFHRFMWRNHLSYAQTYEVELRFGEDRIHPSRKLLFSDLKSVLEERGPSPGEIGSVLDVGCSMGYLLQYLEQGLFSSASRLAGFDIDDYAIARGREHLREQGSIAELRQGDVFQLESLFGSEVFDVVLCTGVLMYLDRSTAAEMMKLLVQHTGKYLVLSGLAHPERDNIELKESVRREEDQSFIHNFDAMLDDTDFRVVFRRWDGSRDVDGNTIYFVIAAPGEDR